MLGEAVPPPNAGSLEERAQNAGSPNLVASFCLDIVNFKYPSIQFRILLHADQYPLLRMHPVPTR